MNGPSHLVLSTIPHTLPSPFAFGRMARPHMRAKSCWNQECQILLKFYYFGSNRDLTFGGHFATPIDRSKNFLRKNVRAHALYQPTKCQPARPRVYRLVHFYQPLLPTLAAILPRPLDRSKKFLRRNVRAHALYQPTKFQPARPSHLRVYTLVLFKRPLLIPQGSLRSPWIIIIIIL